MYSFEPSDEQKMLIDAARKFAARELQTRLREGDETGQLPPANDTGGLGTEPSAREHSRRLTAGLENVQRSRACLRRRSWRGEISRALWP